MSTEIKRVTLEVSPAQHRKLRDACSKFDTTQAELLGYLIDITLSNTDVVKAAVESMVRKRKIEEERQRQNEDKAKQLVSALPPEVLAKLLSGEADLSKL